MGDMVAVGHELEVVRVAARSDPALVVDDHAFGDRATQRGPNEAVDKPGCLSQRRAHSTFGGAAGLLPRWGEVRGRPNYASVFRATVPW